MTAFDYRTVAQADELLPGEATLVQYGRLNVLLFNVGGDYYAVEDRCSHADVRLSDGEIDLSACQITCPRHGSRFDLLTGQALTPPALTPLIRFDVQQVNNSLQIRRRD
ncbi:MAG: Rieske (2Fe-2S) protein [Phototrophicaceae bacterium]|jgi:3-phenylpropionate/trans-cinnamate dioxygenase ferredoxin subunit